MSNKIITFQADTETYRLLLAKRKNLGEASVSAVIRLAINDFFSSKPTSKSKVQTNKKGTSND